jgi:hypothetical protein
VVALLQLQESARLITRLYRPVDTLAATDFVGKTHEGFAHMTRLYQYVDDSEIILTEQQADEYRRIMASCGGVVTSQRIRPRLVAEKEHPA